MLDNLDKQYISLRYEPIERKTIILNYLPAQIKSLWSEILHLNWPHPSHTLFILFI